MTIAGATMSNSASALEGKNGNIIKPERARDLGTCVQIMRVHSSAKLASLYQEGAVRLAVSGDPYGR